MVLVSGLGSGCASLNPYISDLNFISVAQENQISSQMVEGITQEMKVMGDSAMTRKVDQIGQELVRALPERQFDYQFHVVEEDSPNAFAIPGAKIYVHEGLIKIATEDELAGVIAHEIGHAYERHPAKGISRAYGVEYLTSLLLRNKEPGKLGQMGIQLAKGGILSKYTRDDEREADAIAYSILRKTRYSEDGLLSFLKKLNQIGGSHPFPFLSSHPPTPERIERLETMQLQEQMTVRS